jgi:hypothetical protein
VTNRRAASGTASLGAALSHHAFDAATLLSQVFLFDALVAGHQTTWVRTYLWVYLLFCLGIWLKQYDPDYVAGSDRLTKRHPVFVAIGVWVASLVVGAMAVVSLVSGAVRGLTGENLPMAIGIPLTLVLTFLYPVLLAWALYRGRAHPARLRPGTAAALRVVSDFAIFLLTLYLLTFVLSSIAGIRAGGDVHGVMAFLIAVVVAILLVLFYLPGRIHTLMQDPESRANWWSFWITCAAAGAFAVRGVHIGW